MQQSRRRRKREGGQALAEFALIAPIFFLLVFGLIDTARLYQSWVTIQHAAREGARYGVTGRTDCTGYSGAQTRPNCIEYTARLRSDNLANSATDLDVSVRNWQYPSYADPPTANSPGDQCDALEVQIDYAFSPSTPIISNIIGEVPITARERMVNEPFGPCS